MRGGLARWVALLGMVLLLPSGARAENRVYAFGDSYVAPGRAGIQQGQARWVDLLGTPVTNLGHAGDRVPQTLAVVTRVQRRVHGTAIVEVGINDLRLSGTDQAALSSFRRQYALLLQRLRSARLVVLVPPLPLQRWSPRGRFPHGSDAALAAYRDVVVELARSTPHVVVADPLPRWQPSSMLLPDGVHPNALGRAVIAATVQEALSRR